MADRVAWVTGASRGVGRGIAVALGHAGWTVYVTARSTTARTTSHLPGTIDATAAAVTAAGGTGIGISCDHADDAAVASVADRISARHARLDLLVNNAWGGYERLNAGAWAEWQAPFWEQPVELFDRMFTSGVRAHYVALVVSAPLLIAAPGSLVVTTSVSVPSADQEQFGAAYVTAKTADDRLAAAAAIQLRPHAVASVAIHPDWVRTEGVLQFADQVDLSASQSPEGVGRAVVALATDSDVLSLTGQVLTVTWLAERYGLDVKT